MISKNRLLKRHFLVCIITLLAYAFIPISVQAADCRTAGCPNVARTDINGNVIQVPQVCAQDKTVMADLFRCYDVSTSDGGVNLGSISDTNFRLTAPSLSVLISRVANNMIVFSFVILFLYIVWGGYRYLASGGDVKAIQAAKAHLTWAVAGAIIIFLSYGFFLILNGLVNNVYQ